MRLFLAINLPDDVRRGAWQAAEPLRTGRYPVKWVAEESLHITMKFLGDVAPEREREVIDGMQAAVRGARAFSLIVSEFGAFPSLSNPRVVWIGCEPVPPLELLQHRVEQETNRLGFPLEGRPFHPHVTLGRAKRDTRAADFRGLGETAERLEYATSVTVESLDLMESTLTRQGAIYAVRHRATLAGAEERVQ